MFERYTDRARRSVVLAQSEARDLRHPEVDVDHLLLGLASEGEGVAFRALDRCGVSASVIRTEVSLRYCQVTVAASPPNIPFTLPLKRALDLARRESVMLGCNYVGTEHLLLGLLGDAADTTERPVGPCAAALMACGGATPEAVRDAVMVLLNGYRQAEDAAKPDDPMAVILARVDGIARQVESIRRHLGVPE